MAAEDPRETYLREALRAAAEEAVPDTADRLDEVLDSARRARPVARMYRAASRPFRERGRR